VSALAAYGAKTAVFVVQHGCGFAQWQTRAAIPEIGFVYNYSVPYSPWGASGDDMAARFVASCKKFNITPGFYLAVATNHFLRVNNNVVRGGPLNQAQYEQVVLQMLKELWTNYGPIGEHWFDGGYPQSGPFGAAVASLFAQLQPQAVMFQGPGAQAVRWAGTEAGVAGDPNWSTADSSLQSGPGNPNATGFFPANCDTTLQEGDQWSYNPSVGLRTLAELIAVYHSTVGRNCNLELDWAPYEAGELAGTLPANQSQRFAEFGAWIRSCYGPGNTASTTAGNTTRGPDGVYSLTLNLPAGSGEVDRLALGEDQAYGERVMQFTIVGEDGSTVLASGKSVGNKRIFQLSQNISAPASFTLRVQAAKAQPIVRFFSAFHSCPTG